jgi:hypothetical protein
MPDQTKEVGLNLKAKDETADTFENAKRQMEDLRKEAHSGTGKESRKPIQGIGF